MNVISFPRFPMSALAALALSGCAAIGHGHSTSHGPEAGRHESADMQAMCEMHRRMMASGSPAEQRAMMDDEMKNMSMTPEMMQQRMQAMQQHCK